MGCVPRHPISPGLAFSSYKEGCPSVPHLAAQGVAEQEAGGFLSEAGPGSPASGLHAPQ